MENKEIKNETIENNEDQNLKKNKKRKYKGLIISGSILAVIFLFLLTINLIPPKKVMEVNPFISTTNLPLNCAHRGGGVSNPENTLKAYKNAIKDFNVEILETDLWMTKDNQLILSHDESINRTSDVEEITNSSEPYLISDHTLEELSNFNFGYKFVDKEGNRPYQDLVSFDDPNRKEIIKENDLSVLTFDEWLNAFYTDHKEMLFIVEIKNGGEKGYQAAEIIDDLLTNKYPEFLDHVIIGTFHPEIEKDLEVNHPTLLRGASTSGAAKFVITTLLGVNLFDFDTLGALMLPESMYGFDLTWDIYINEAHERNMAVQYWTINDEGTMRKFIEKGVDAIMTDDPELLNKVLEEYR